MRSDTLVYRRADDQQFTRDDKLSNASYDQTKLFYGVSEYGISCQDFLRFNNAALKKLATGPDSGPSVN